MVTYLDAVIAVLEEAGGPLNYGEIARRALEGGMIPRTKSMESNVSKVITTHLEPPNDVFVKVGRGVYDLNPGHDRAGPRGGAPRVRRGSRRDTHEPEDNTPVMAYSEYLYRTRHGHLVKGTINRAITFMFCEKDRKLFNSGLKENEVSSALYALLDTETNRVYVGITRRGPKRITDHWKDRFTHVGIMFGTVTWSTDLRLKLEEDLTEIFRTLSWSPTNQASGTELEAQDNHMRGELMPSLRQVAARVGFLARNMDTLYFDHAPAAPRVMASTEGRKARRPRADARAKKPAEPRFSTDPAVRHCWVWPCPKSSYEIVRRDGIWASKATPENIGARVRRGNLVTFYVKEHRAFCGVYEVAGEWYGAVAPVWPDEVEAGRTVYPSQVRLRAVKGGRAPLDAMRPLLGIFRGSAAKNVGLALRSSNGYPGNHGRPIPDSDMEAISDGMRPVGAGADPG